MTSIGYDVFGNTLSVTDPLNNVTSYSYNKLNQLVTESNGIGARSYSYDGMQNLRSAVDRNDRLTQWNYDKLYRVTTETWRQTSSPSSTILRTFGYYYDRVGRLIEVADTDPLASEYAYMYDAASQLTDLRRYASTGTSSLQVHSRFGRDQAGRLTSITHGRTGIASGQHWDGSATPPASLGTAGLLAGYTFEYDQANRLNEMRSWADGTQTSYGYDDRSQLTAATTTAIIGMTPPFGLPGGEGYDFDAGGNRQGSGGTPQSATGTHNQLQTDGAYNYFYDGEGNLIRRESLSNFAATLYEWDHRNRLVSVKEAPFYQAGPIYQNMLARRIEYIYDAFDQRVGRRIEDTGAGYGIWGIEWKRYEAYVWADGQEVLRFTDSDGLESALPFRLANRYLWSNQVDQLLAKEQYTGNSGPAIGAPAAHPSEGETFWPLTDHLGSVRGLVDNNGVIRQHVSYDSFGNRLVEQHYDSAGAPVAASHAEAVDTLFGYTGRAWDADTGLQYNRARWYNPSTGRWLSQDPIGFNAGDANLYRYVGNQPTTKVDPSGLDNQYPWHNDSGWDYLNPWAYNFPIGQRSIIDGVFGAIYSWGPTSRAIELDQQIAHRRRMEAYNNPQCLDVQAFQNTYRMSEAQASRVRLYTEAGIQVNAMILGGGALRPSGVGLIDDLPMQLPADQAGIAGLQKIPYTLQAGKLRRPLTGGTSGSFKGQRIDFIISSEGHLVLGRGHSVLSDGCSVRFAGQLKFNRNGVLVEITNNSGHYRPPSGKGLTQKAKDYLEQLGIDISGANVVEINGIQQ